ncbi:MAG: hypothetical protein KDJ15_03885 [Alphaproteobacteria bacterium]|nr:hypothetical protein [Alphaproteobacteria bacterium]
MNENDIKTEIESLKTRNARVEADKAWETSLTRRAAIAGGTYVVVWAYLSVLGVDHAYFHALVPAGAFVISTLTLPIVKRIWLERSNLKQKF